MYRTNVDATAIVRVATPPVSPERGGLGGTTLDRIVFANALDGYATTGASSPSTLYVTTDGARTWRRVMHASDLSISVVATSDEIFVTTYTCRRPAIACGQYTTRRASLTARSWVTLPRLWAIGTASGESYYGPSLAASGRTVWELQTGPRSSLWISHDDGRTFARVLLRFPELVSVAGCAITPMSTVSLWAACPTGMEESFWHSANGGASWSAASPARLEFSGTGGGAFDPVTPDVAMLDYGPDGPSPDLYRISGGGSGFSPIGEVRCLNADPIIFVDPSHGLMLCGLDLTSSLRRTSDGGVTWVDVRLPRD